MMNKRNIKLIYTCIALLLCQNVILQAQEDKLIGSKKLLKDFDQLERIIEAHPDPYTHIPEKVFKARFEKLKSTLDHPHSTLEFYKKAASIVASIKDGHSSVRLPRFWLENQRKKKGAFPYEVHLTNNDELYIIKNYNEGVIPKGSKIVSINGISVDSFLKVVDPYISYETKNFRNTLIDGYIDFYLYLAFGVAEKTTIEYFTSDTLSTEVKNMPFKEWKKFQKNNREKREKLIMEGKPYAYTKVSDGIGLINIYAFRTPSVRTYNLFLLKTFKEIARDSIHSLIIDIRGNFGGWPKVSSRLFHYLSENYFKTMAQSSMKVSHAYRNNIFDRYPALRSSRATAPQRRHFIDIEAIISKPIGSYVYEDKFFNEPPNTESYEFTGDCYLLTNRDSYSAASSFASTFQCYRIGTIIGEETGGTKIFRANAINEKLNKSGLRVSMSTTKLFTTCYNQEFEGVQPTIEYTPSILEIVSGMDTQLLYTQRIIKKVQRKKITAMKTE